MNILNYITITIFSLLTTIIFIFLILYSDRKSKEPKHIILLCLLSGIFPIFISLIFGQLILPKLQVISPGLFDYNNSIFKVLILALVEEYSKLVVLYLILSRNKNFDDIYDGFVYSSLIALSFAAIESLIYVFNETNVDTMKSLALLRGITTIPLHLICGISMGYFMGKEKFSWGTKTRVTNLMLCLIFPTFLHFTYNFTLSNIIAKYFNSNILILLILLFFIPFYLIGILFISKSKFLNNKYVNNEHYKNLMTKNEYDEIINNY